MKNHCKMIAIWVTALCAICGIISAWQIRGIGLLSILYIIIWGGVAYAAYVLWKTFAEILTGIEDLQYRIRGNQTKIAGLEKLLQNMDKEKKANANKEKEEEHPASGNIVKMDPPGKELAIARYSLGAGIKPCRLEAVRLQGQYGFRLELFCGPRVHITSMIADLIMATEFGDTYEIKDIGFTNFKMNKLGHLVSDITVRPILTEQMFMTKSIAVVIKKYIENGTKVELDEEAMALGKDDSVQEWSEEDIAYLMPALEALESSKEIFEALTAYAKDGNRILDQKLDTAIKSCMQNESIGSHDKRYGSTERAMSLIKSYFMGPQDPEDKAGGSVPVDKDPERPRTISQIEDQPNTEEKEHHQEQQVKFCISCGRRLAENERFCIKCGTKTGL